MSVGCNTLGLIFLMRNVFKKLYGKNNQWYSFYLGALVGTEKGNGMNAVTLLDDDR
jgi:hypothetical protein